MRRPMYLKPRLDIDCPAEYEEVFLEGIEALGLESPSVSVDDLKRKYSDINQAAILDLIKGYEILDKSVRGCLRDKDRDNKARELMDAILELLEPHKESLPPSWWHRCNRHNLFLDPFSITEFVNTPYGEAELIIYRPAKQTGWHVAIRKNDEIIENRVFVKMGSLTKVRFLGVEPLWEHDFERPPAFWGLEVYIASPHKVVGCEYNWYRKQWSLFRDFKAREDYFTCGDLRCFKASFFGKSLRQGDVLFIPQHQKEPGEDWEETSNPNMLLNRVTFEGGEVKHYLQFELKYVNRFILLEKPVKATHPDHPSVILTDGIWQVAEVPGRTDYRPGTVIDD